MAETVTDTDDTADTPVEQHQTVRRLPPEREVGPFYPSGMSAPEAAMAGATAGMSDADAAKVQEQAAELGLGDAPDGGVSAVTQGDAVDPNDDPDGPGGRPALSANKAEWEDYRTGQGHNVEGLTKEDLIGLSDTP